MEKGNPERKKLRVNSVGQVEGKARRDGQGTFKTISFNADDITDPEVKKGYAYSVANPILVSVIEIAKKDDILDADVRKLTGEREGGIGWTIHQVVQLYKDDQPMSGQKQKYGRSLETVQLEIDARAKNTALMQACELAKADRIGITEILIKSTEFYTWLQNTKALPELQVLKAKVISPGEELFPEDNEPPEDQEKLGFVNAIWFRDSLKTLQAKKIKSYSESNLLSYFKTTYKVEEATVLEAVAKLDKNQATHFTRKMQEDLSMVKFIPHEYC